MMKLIFTMCLVGAVFAAGCSAGVEETHILPFFKNVKNKDIEEAYSQLFRRSPIGENQEVVRNIISRTSEIVLDSESFENPVLVIRKNALSFLSEYTYLSRIDGRVYVWSFVIMHEKDSSYINFFSFDDSNESYSTVLFQMDNIAE